MTTYRDTTRQDWGLVIAGVLALAFFFWFYGEYHPFGVADNSLGETMASQNSAQYLGNIGFNSDRAPNVRYKVNTSLLDTLQKHGDFQEFYKREDNRSLSPVFYWESSFYVESLQNENINFGASQAKIIRVDLDETGDVIGLENDFEVIPNTFYNADALTFALESRPVINTEIDSSIFDRVSFSFNESDSTGFDRINLSEQNIFGEDIAEKIADYHFSLSGWNRDDFQVQSIENTLFGDVGAASITYKSVDSSTRPTPELEFIVLPTGLLVSLDYSFIEGTNGGVNFSEIISNIRVGIILLVLFWILIMLFVRFRMRLIDMKAAILIAVLAGFIYPFLTLMEMLFDYAYGFGTVNTSFFLTLFLILGFVAASTSIAFFIVTSIADSITRQKWVEKLRTIDLIRTGYFVSRPVGLAFVRAASYAFIISAAWVVMFMLIPDGYISVEETQFGSSRYLPNIVMVLGNLGWFFIISQVIFLIILGYIRNLSSSSVIPILLTGFIFAVMNPMSIILGPLWVELLVMFVIGIIAGTIYLKHDYLTIFLSLFFSAGLLYSAPGWLLESSADTSIFYTQMAIIILSFAFGGYAIFRGKSLQEIPQYVPEYIEELAQEERIKQEIQIARKVQESFLPDRTPDFDGLDIAAICKPAYETGGDYYDFIELDNERLAVTIGDVSGKGIQAAFFMTFTKGVLHAICEDFKSTTEVLTKTNNLFRRNANRGTFISLIFGVVDQKNSRFKFSRAGHNPLLYFNSREKKLYEYKPQGIGLGMANEKVFSKNIQEQEINFEKNDLLIMFTDGVVEATNKMNAFYGDERLHKLVKKNHQLSSEKILETILTDLESFGENSNQHDDMTMLVIKKR